MTIVNALLLRGDFELIFIFNELEESFIDIFLTNFL